MRKGIIAVWAVATFGFAWLLFALVMPVFNEAQSTGRLARAYAWLLIPFAAQGILLAGGALYSSWRKRREVVTGILWGFGPGVWRLLVSSRHCRIRSLLSRLFLDSLRASEKASRRCGRENKRALVAFKFRKGGATSGSPFAEAHAS